MKRNSKQDAKKLKVTREKLRLLTKELAVAEMGEIWGGLPVCYTGSKEIQF